LFAEPYDEGGSDRGHDRPGHGHAYPAGLPGAPWGLPEAPWRRLLLGPFVPASEPALLAVDFFSAEVDCSSTTVDFFSATVDCFSAGVDFFLIG
jgi:hypothetical protein